MLVRLLFCLSILLAPAAQAADFTDWLVDFKVKAKAEGISENTVLEAFEGVNAPIAQVVELDRKQPEGRLSFAQYRRNIVNPKRIAKGRKLLRENRVLLDGIARQYGVQPHYIVALWGIETNFGTFTGGFSVVHALATLAHDGRRAKFFTQELINALKIIDQGHIQAARMKGSWAGAMGQNQFMPSSFLRFAVDQDKDGRKDIWGTRVDIFASSAQYLSQSGWNYGQRWGRAITLPAGFDRRMIADKTKKLLSDWKALGVNVPPVETMRGYIIQPDGAGSQAFIVYNNFETILKWNRSNYFATSVGLLADAIGGA